MATGCEVAGLLARQSSRSAAGTARAGVGLGAGTAAGRLIVARASLVHQITAAATATTVAIAAAASRSAVVRRSGLTIGRQRRRVSWRRPRELQRPLLCGGADGGGEHGCRRRTRRRTCPW